MNDRMRPDTFADYFEKVQWARNHEIDQQKQEDLRSPNTYTIQKQM